MMILQRAALLGALASLAPGMAHAEPATTAWLEDVSVEAPRTTETVLSYTHQLSDMKARGAGFDQLTLALHAGVSESVAIAPKLGLEQRGTEPLRLSEVGFQARWLAFERAPWPSLMAYGGYSNDLGDARDHLLESGVAARYEYGPLYLNGDVRATSALGGDADTSIETWYGLGAGYAWLHGWLLRAGLESFAILPLKGERLSDPTFGEAAESTTLYYGPSLAFATSPLWAACSAVTGYPVSTPASQFMLSCVVGVAH
jgi:hypothetical protein